MEKALLMIAVLLSLTACEKAILNDVDTEDGQTEVSTKTKKFKFTVKGDFGTATFTRGYLQADGQDMTDLWVFDFMDGECVQSLHQTNDDADFGKPTMKLAYGSHHVYFVASRGDSPVLAEEATTIVWAKAKDTFWKDYAVDVVSTSNGNRAVTLDRVATKLKLTVNDEVPANCSQVCITPDRWFYGIDYTDGMPVSAKKQEYTISVPASYVGTTGKLSLSIMCISPQEEWTTDVSIQAKDASGGVIGAASITAAPFKANRSTEYSGNLFSSGGELGLSLATEWQTPITGTW